MGRDRLTERREGQGGTGRGKEDGVVDIVAVGGWWALIAIGGGVGCLLPLKVVLSGHHCWWVMGIHCHWWVVMLGSCRCWCMVGDGRLSLLVQGGGGSSLSLGGVVGSLRSVLMAVVGPHGWWWLCSSPLVGGNGPWLSFVLLGCWHCHWVACRCAVVTCYCHPSVVSCHCSCHCLVALMTMNDESFVIHPLIAMSPSAMWHLPGTCSLAGAGDMALRGHSCRVTVCCGGCGWWRQLVMVVMGGARWVS